MADGGCCRPLVSGVQLPTDKQNNYSLDWPQGIPASSSPHPTPLAHLASHFTTCPPHNNVARNTLHAPNPDTPELAQTQSQFVGRQSTPWAASHPRQHRRRSADLVHRCRFPRRSRAEKGFRASASPATAEKLAEERIL